MGPDRFNNGAKRGGSPQITEELSQDPCIVRNTDRFTAWLARQPTEHGLIQLPMAVPGRVLDEKSIELSECELRAPVSIAEVTLELKKTLQLGRNRTTEDVIHRGTGRPTARRRLKATRT